jgi:hypothetical protein
MISPSCLRLTLAQPRAAQAHLERPIKLAACSVLALLASSPVGSMTPPPHGPSYDAMTWPMSMHKPPARGISLGTFRVVFEETALEEVRVKVGSGTVSHQGDAAASEYWLCYSVLSQSHRERVWIVSNAEMGAGKVTAVVAIALASSEPSGDCPLLPSQLLPVTLDSNLWLGASAADLARTLGKPSHVAHHWRSYAFQTKIEDQGKCEGGYDRIDDLDVKLHRGRVVALSAGQVTTC